MARIITNKVYTMQTFLEVITERTYINHVINDRTFIHKILNYYHIPTQSYALSEFSIIGNDCVVLVECFNIEDEENEYIWFLVPYSVLNKFGETHEEL